MTGESLSSLDIRTTLPSDAALLISTVGTDGRQTFARVYPSVLPFTATLPSIITGISAKFSGGQTSADWSAQGATIGWNYSNGGGKTSFVNSKGLGLGGFEFYNVTSLANATPLKMLTIDADTNSATLYDAQGKPTGLLARSGSLRIGKRTQGQGDNGCVLTAIANSNRADSGGQAGVLGYTPGLGALAYGDIDSVTLYAENAGRDPLIVKDNVTFSAGQMSFAVPLTAAERALLFNGMNLLTNHSPRWGGFVASWAADGSSVTLIEGWGVFGAGGQAPGLVPPAGLTFKVAFAPLTKVWGHNTNVFIGNSVDGVAYGEFGAQKSAGFELGTFNEGVNHTWQGEADPNNRYSWGFDSINLGSKRGSSAFISRGVWDVAFHARSGSYAAFLVDGVNYTSASSVGFMSTQTAGFPFLHQVSGVNRFIVDISGNVASIGNFNIAGSVTAAAHIVPTTATSGFISQQTSGFPFVHQIAGSNKFTVDAAGNIVAVGSVTASGNVIVGGSVTAAAYIIPTTAINGFISQQTSGFPFVHQIAGVNKFTVDVAGSIASVGNFNTTGSVTAGAHIAPPTATTGFISQQTSGFSFVHQISGVNKFTVDVAGSIIAVGSAQHGGGVSAFGVTPPASRPAITGSRGAATASVLTQVLSALSAAGFITDSTTA